MRKNLAPMDVEKPPTAFRPWLAVRLVVVALAIAPFLYEGMLTCYARWTRILGTRTSIRTPVLDHVGRLIHSARAAIFEQFRRVPWNPQVVLVVGVLSCAACMLLLRGRGSRIE